MSIISHSIFSALVLAALVANGEAHRGGGYRRGWYRYRYGYRYPYSCSRTCFTVWSAFDTCTSSFVDGNGNPCGSTGRKQSTRGPSASTWVHCSTCTSEKTIRYSTCSLSAPLAVCNPSPIACDYSVATDLTAIASNCNNDASGATNTLYTLSPPALNVNGPVAIDLSTGGSGTAPLGHFVGSIVFNASPDLFCFKYSYELEANTVLHAVLFEDQPDAVELQQIASGLYGTGWIARSHSIATSASSNQAYQFRHTSGPFRVGFIAEVISGTPAGGTKINKFSLDETSTCTA